MGNYFLKHGKLILLKNNFNQIVNENTGYTGTIIIKKNNNRVSAGLKSLVRSPSISGPGKTRIIFWQKLNPGF